MSPKKKKKEKNWKEKAIYLFSAEEKQKLF